MKKNREQGYLTLMAAIFVMLMLAMGTIFLVFLFRTNQNVKAANRSLTARLVAEAGFEKAIWMLNNTNNYAGEEGSHFNNLGDFDVVVSDINPTTKKIQVISHVPSKEQARITRTLQAQVFIDTPIVSFTYALQSGNGGFKLGNNSIINGNVYSNGTIVGASNAEITGDAFSVGENGKVENVIVRGNAHAREIRNCTVDGDAKYNIIHNCQISGSSEVVDEYPEAHELPITLEQVNTWKEQAEEGEVINGNLTVSGTQSLGPNKIEGDLVISNHTNLTIEGTLWVTGKLTINNGAQIKLAPGYNQRSEAIVTDGNIVTGNNIVFEGSGADNSYIVFASESSSLNSSDPAIDIQNGLSAAVFYARNGLIKLMNNAQIKQIAAHQIELGNNIILNYDSGLLSVDFSSEGPGGSWFYQRGTFVNF